MNRIGMALAATLALSACGTDPVDACVQKARADCGRDGLAVVVEACIAASAGACTTSCVTGSTCDTDSEYYGEPARAAERLRELLEAD